MDLTVTDVPERQRYEARAGGERVGFAAYTVAGEQITFTHTEVDPAHEGEGVGSALVRGALDDARRRGLSVRPVCPFVGEWMRRHPDYDDLRDPGTAR